MDQIEQVNREIKQIKGELAIQRSDFASACGDGFDYLALGNSITIHPVCDYWPEQMGMAAESLDKDYVHLLVELFQKGAGIEDVNYFAYNLSSWETIHYDRAETVTEIDALLHPDIDLITVQLGENITQYHTLESDFEYFIGHIKEKSPSAKIIMIGNFWENKAVDKLKKKVSEKQGCVYISLEEIQGEENYESKIGNQVYDREGNVSAIDRDSVAKHPGNAGMRYIAESIYREYRKSIDG